MAAGDFTIFEEFAAQLGGENHNFAATTGDDIKLALIDDTLAPTAAAAAVWATWSANDVSAAGGYTADGISIKAGQSYTEVDGVGTYDSSTNISLSQDTVNGFTDARYGILYNSTNATDMAIGFLDLGAVVSEKAGDISIAWGASGIFSVTITP